MRFVIPILLGVALSRGRAQSPEAPVDSLASGKSGQATAPRRPLVGRNTRAMLLATAAVGGAVSLFDPQISLGAQRLGGDDMRKPSSLGSFVGGPLPLTLGASLYAVGRTTRYKLAAKLGREVTRAVLVSGALTALTKGLVGRARPFAAPDDPDVFSPGRGFTHASLASFPSGHTSAAFATAAVLARELHAVHPRQQWWINSLLFGGAAFVGYSRVYQQQHWPSDVVAGAALGGITGYEVVAHARGDRSAFGWHLFSHVAVSPSQNGVSLAWKQ